MTASHSAQRIILALISATGAAIFAFFFALTFNTPEWVEMYAADFIEREALKQIDAKIDYLRPPSRVTAVARAATAQYKKNEDDIERHRESLRLQVNERMSDAIAEVRDLDCECRAMWAEWLNEGSTMQIHLFQKTNEDIADFIQATYAQVVAVLKRDMRIFTAVNTAIFLLLLAVVIIKPRANLQLFVPGFLAAAATVLCSYFYLFEQNWLLTIIYNNYLGFSYLAYLGLVFGLLCDIVLNRARITTEVVNAILNAIGSAASAVPC